MANTAIFWMPSAKLAPHTRNKTTVVVSPVLSINTHWHIKFVIINVTQNTTRYIYVSSYTEYVLMCSVLSVLLCCKTLLLPLKLEKRSKRNVWKWDLSSLSMYIIKGILLQCVDLVSCITSRCSCNAVSRSTSGLVRYCITQATQRDTTQQINTLYIVVFCMYLGLAIELKSLKRPHFVSLEGWFY